MTAKEKDILRDKIGTKDLAKFNHTAYVRLYDVFTAIDSLPTDPEPQPEPTPHKPTSKDMYAFAEWVAYNYVRLTDFWVHKYSNQLDKANWQSTDQLYKFWCKYVFKPSTQITVV